jgi:hypothetical protein
MTIGHLRVKIAPENNPILTNSPSIFYIHRFIPTSSQFDTAAIIPHVPGPTTLKVIRLSSATRNR